MAAIPLLIYDKGFCEVVEGALFNPPSELFTGAQMSFYSLARQGWSQCPLGYWVYVAIDALGRRIAVPGIRLADKPAPKRKFPNYPLQFTSQQIEKFLLSHLELPDRVRKERDTEVNNLTHDLRALGTEIYHTALITRDRHGDLSDEQVRGNLQQIIDAQQMMSLRLDIIDYESGSSAKRPHETFSIFPKIDKVLKTFSGLIRSKNISARIDGKSYNSVQGPPIFEIVPFVIIENALKYAPFRSEITIRLQDDDGKAVVRFDSFGPKISPKEKIRIFDRNFRGDAAAQMESSGSGIGLYAAKTITETHFKGRIFVNQLDGVLWVDGVEYFSTRFTVVLPAISEEDAATLQIRPKRRKNGFR